MDWGFIVALVIALLAIVSVFVDISIVSGCAFWVLLGALPLFLGMGYDRERRKKEK